MATPTIKIDQVTKPAGVAEQSRDDLVTGQLVTLTDPANGAGTYLWELYARPEGSAATLSGASTDTATFTPDVEGDYLVRLTFDADKSWTEDAIFQTITTQGGCIVRTASEHALYIPSAGETGQQSTTTGWSYGQDYNWRTVNTKLPTTNEKTDIGNLGGAHGSVYYVDSGGRLQRLSPGTDGQFFQTRGAGANPEWSNTLRTSLLVDTDNTYDIGATGAKVRTVYVGTSIEIDSGGVGDPLILAGTVDPSAGGGVAAPEGSLYHRYVAAAGEIWYKSGAAATAWTQVASGAGGVSLDGAYDFGGPGVGRTITADAGAVVMTTAATDANNVLELTKAPASTQAGNALNITMGANATGWAIQTGAVQVGGDVAQSGATAINHQVLQLNGPAHTTMTASTRYDHVDFDLSTEVEFATGNFDASTNLRGMIIRAPTYGFVGASTIDLAATMYIDSGPNPGTAATITHSVALHTGGDIGLFAQRNALATSSAPGVVTANRTAATVGTPVQVAPGWESWTQLYDPIAGSTTEHKSILVYGGSGGSTTDVAVSGFFRVDATGPTFDDYTAEANSATANDCVPFPATEAVGDWFAVGYTSRFSEITFNVGTAGSGGSPAITYEYWAGPGGWTAVTGKVDNTNNLTTAGTNTLRYNTPLDWWRRSLGPDQNDGQWYNDLYWIRGRLTSTYTTTNPLLTQVWIGGYDPSSLWTLQFDGGTGSYPTPGGDEPVMLFNDDGTISAAMFASQWDNLEGSLASAVYLYNKQASTAGVPTQLSPGFQQEGTVWDGSASRTVKYMAAVAGVDGAGARGLWNLYGSYAGAEYDILNPMLSIDTAGDLFLFGISHATWANAFGLTDAATINYDLDDSNLFRVTLGGNRTLATPSNLNDGQQYKVIVKQDATGSRTLSYSSAYKFPGGVAPTLSTGANAVDVLECVVDGSNILVVDQLNFS